MADVHQRYSVLAEGSAELSGNRGQEKILGVAFDDDNSAGEEKVRLRGVEKTAKECIVIRFQLGLRRR